MRSHLSALLLVLAGSAASGFAAERINHEGRVLGDPPVVATPTLFNTAAADAVVSAMQILPRDNAWNEDISGLPVAANSAAMIANIRNDITQANRKRVVVFKEMNFVLVPDSQPLVDIDFIDYPDESDDLKPVGPGNNPAHIGSWPIPSNLPVESWPSEQPGVTLNQWQLDTSNVGGDRHSITVMPGTGFIWETWQTKLTTGTPAWTASNGAKFPLNANTLRPDGWTSADAAGLAMFPALMRFDEGERGVVEHALRIVVKRSRRSYIYPASHQAGSTTDVDVPAMGQRLRLKSSFVIPASWTKQERAIAVALKKYGALVADNGNFFSISITPDDRWPAGCFNHLSTGSGSDICDIDNFEVVQATGPTGGPRSPGSPTANAGTDQGVALAAGASLAGSATGTGLTTTWSVVAPAPGTVTFAAPSNLATTATFGAAGTYTLLLKASDGVHTPAFDAVVITVSAGSNPVPALTILNPTNRIQGSGSFTLTLTGTGFVANSTVTWTGQASLSPTTATATQLTVNVPASYLATVGTPSITVVNPVPGGGSSGALAFTIVGDTTLPIISAVAASGVTATAATITWTTSEAATSQVEYGLTTAYGSTTTLDATLKTSHSQALSGLTANTTYHVRVRSSDGAGNPAISGDATFTTGSPGDTTPPVISGIGASGVTTSNATITWTTNEPATSQVEYGLTAAYGSTTTVDAALKTSHSQAIPGLTNNALYHFRVRSTDAAGNAAISGDTTFTTAVIENTMPSTCGSASGLGLIVALLAGLGLIAVRSRRS